MNEVIIIGGNHHNALGVIRALGEVGFSPILILTTKEKKPFVSYSKYLKRVIVLESDEKIIETLLSKCKSKESKSVVICCSDSSSSIIDLNRDKLLPFFCLPGAKEQGRITYLMNKQVMSDLATSVGLQVPITLLGKEIDNNNLPLPCIIKPIISKDGTKQEIHICYSKEEVNKYVNEIGQEKVQVQEFIDKEFEYQLIGCSTSKEVIIPGISKIIRPCKGSNTSFLHYEPVDNGLYNINKCKEFVERTGYKGLFSVEFLRDKKGVDFFMEINFRNDGNAICVTEAGVNLPYIWYLSSLDLEYIQESSKIVKNCYIMPDWAEFELLHTRQISFGDFYRDLKKTNRFMEYDKKDPKPFWRMLWNKILTKFNNS